jgi:hypothetical protein
LLRDAFLLPVREKDRVKVCAVGAEEHYARGAQTLGRWGASSNTPVTGWGRERLSMAISGGFGFVRLTA